MSARICGRWLGVLLTAALAGCSSMRDVVKEKTNGGTSGVYAVTRDQAWKIAIEVFRWEGADVIEQHPEEGYMLTSSTMGIFTMGTLMGAWIKPVSESEVEVKVVTKRRMVLNIATTLTETTFLRRFEQAVAFLRAGKPLPSDPPPLK